jgi:hypothetical protein
MFQEYKPKFDGLSLHGFVTAATTTTIYNNIGNNNEKSKSQRNTDDNKTWIVDLGPVR